MKLIRELLREAEKENQRDPESFLTARSKQELREQWVLGKFSLNYNKLVQHKLTYAERYEKTPRYEKAPRSKADFKVFNTKKEWIFDVEITEALDECRKRTLEYRTEDEDGGKVIFIPEENYLPVIQRLISQKCSKDYPGTTLLIIYLNVVSSIYDEFAPKTFSSLYLPEKCNLLQIWLLDSGGDKILQLS